MKSLQAYTTVLEKIFLIGLIAGGIFFTLKAEPFGTTVTAVSLFGLGLAYFLSAYRPGEINDDERTGNPKELLVFMIIPKVLWLSSSVCLVAIALLVLGSDGSSYQKMFLICGVTLAVAVVLALIAVIGLKDSSSSLWSILLRAIPVLGADLYFLLR